MTKLPKWVPIGVVLIIVSAVGMIWYIIKVAPDVQLNPFYLERKRCEMEATRAYNACMNPPRDPVGPGRRTHFRDPPGR
jgi:hypothetical protein